MVNTKKDTNSGMNDLEKAIKQLKLKDTKLKSKTTTTATRSSSRLKYIDVQKKIKETFSLMDNLSLNIKKDKDTQDQQHTRITIPTYENKKDLLKLYLKPYLTAEVLVNAAKFIDYLSQNKQTEQINNVLDICLINAQHLGVSINETYINILKERMKVTKKSGKKSSLSPPLSVSFDGFTQSNSDNQVILKFNQVSDFLDIQYAVFYTTLRKLEQEEAVKRSTSSPKRSSSPINMSP
jgi:hypothetical protein